MADEAPKAQIFALPVGPNGLPDLLLLESEIWQSQAIVRAFIAPSARDSRGYWHERFNAQGVEGLGWARAVAMERAREYFMERRSPNVPIELHPFKLVPFTDWETLSVQRSLGLYPTLELAARNASGTEFLNLLREKHTVGRVEISEQHYKTP